MLELLVVPAGFRLGLTVCQMGGLRTQSLSHLLHIDWRHLHTLYLYLQMYILYMHICIYIIHIYIYTYSPIKHNIELSLGNAPFE